MTKSPSSNYAARYDNDLFTKASDLIEVELSPEAGFEPHSVTNKAGDVALWISNPSEYPNYEHAWIDLARLAGNWLSLDAIEAIATFLRPFLPEDKRESESWKVHNVYTDWYNTTKALYYLRQILKFVRDARDGTYSIRSWQGRTASWLLSSVEMWIIACHNLLIHGDVAYIYEKMHAGYRHVKWAYEEAHKHSEKPHLFKQMGEIHDTGIVEE